MKVNGALDSTDPDPRAVVALGTIMTISDVTIANVAIPTLGARFGASIPTIGRLQRKRYPERSPAREVLA